MDLSYATIPHPEGGFVTLYREPIVRYQVEGPQSSMDEIMYLDETMGNFCAINPIAQEEECQSVSDIWTLEFDGAHSNSGSGAGIVLVAPSHEATLFSYRLEFDCTNNIVEYEALIIGLDLALDRKIKCLRVIGDSDLVVSQVKKKFVAKNERLRKYRNSIWDTIELFDAFSIEVVPREKNHIVDALAISATTLQPTNNFSDNQVNVLVESMNLIIKDLLNDTLPKGVVPLERMSLWWSFHSLHYNQKYFESLLLFSYIVY
jgi:ribonuclease HI